MATKEDTIRIDVESVEKAQTRLVRLTGVVDAHTYQEVEELFEGCFGDGVFRLIVDLAGVRYISSAGIGVFIGALARARQQDGDLLLVNISGTVEAALDVLGLRPMFVCAPDKAAALSFFERRGAYVKK